MDVKSDVAMQEKAERLPFPPSDFDRNGKLRSVRGRMVKKLLKYEWRYIFPRLFLAIGILLISAVLLGICGLVAERSAHDWRVFLFMLYSYANFGVLAVAFGVPSKRYENHFFKKEGYLTFSIPATAEEHVTAKRLSAIASLALGVIALLVGGAIVACFANTDFSEPFRLIGRGYEKSFVNALFITVEITLLALVGMTLVPSVVGALQCFTQKFTGKKRFVMIFLVVFLLVATAEGTLFGVLSNGLFWTIDSSIEIHLFLWLVLLVNAAFCVACIAYEIHTLKRKLNLK